MSEPSEPLSRARRIGGAGYFAFHALVVLAWWAAMFYEPSWRVHFHSEALGQAGLLTFFWAELPLCLLTLYVAWAAWRDPASRWTQRLMWAAVGGWCFAAIYVLGMTLQSGGQAWLATMMMLPCAANAILAAWTLRPGEPLFRVASEGSKARHVLHTFAHTSVFWMLSLGLMPWLVIRAERALGLPTFTAPAQSWLPWLLFVPVGLFNIWTGYTMAVMGEGTPLPMETAAKLVVQGPYRVLRNPMAASGLTLGALVGWFLGSYGVLAVVLAGGLTWNLFVRPIEERDLVERFGGAYARYCNQVPCWIPRWPPYKPSPALDD